MGLEPNPQMLHSSAWSHGFTSLFLGPPIPTTTKPSKVIIQTEASEYDLSAALIQDGCPIAFASKTITYVEKWYANKEHECLSVCFSLEKFHTYIYGRHIAVQNNHKLLEMVQHKLINATSSNLQCIILWLHRYNFTIQYKPGKEMV